VENIQRRFMEAVHGERFLTGAEAKHQVFEYIEVYWELIR